MGSTTLVRGALSGLLAAVVMNLPMLAQRDGYVPAYVAAGATSGRDPTRVPTRDAAIAHHVAGALAGVLSVLLARPVAKLAGERIGGAVAVVGVVAFVDAFFSRIVFSLRGGEIVADDDRARGVRDGWRRSTLVYGLVLWLARP